MGKNSNIEWTDHTFNPWIGCIKVSPGCQNCYAMTLDKRWGHDRWGPGSKRQRTSDANWRKPLSWDRQAKAEGRRYRVFCASLADIFEDNDQLIDWRLDLFRELIHKTPSLDWLLLTKRPDIMSLFFRTYTKTPARNVTPMFSAEDQQRFNERWSDIKWFIKNGYTIGISAEPLIGPILLPDDLLNLRQQIWVITGGESGPNARPCHPNWVRSIRDQCQQAGVNFFHKQWGEYCPGSQLADLPEDVKEKISGSKNMSYWMDQNGQLDKEFFPRNGMITNAWEDGWDMMVRVGKKNAGRMLDGQVWNEFPNADRERF